MVARPPLLHFTVWLLPRSPAFSFRSVRRSEKRSVGCCESVRRAAMSVFLTDGRGEGLIRAVAWSWL